MQQWSKARNPCKFRYKERTYGTCRHGEPLMLWKTDEENIWSMPFLTNLVLFPLIFSFWPFYWYASTCKTKVDILFWLLGRWLCISYWLINYSIKEVIVLIRKLNSDPVVTLEHLFSLIPHEKRCSRLTRTVLFFVQQIFLIASDFRSELEKSKAQNALNFSSSRPLTVDHTYSPHCDVFCWNFGLLFTCDTGWSGSPSPKSPPQCCQVPLLFDKSGRFFLASCKDFLLILPDQTMAMLLRM